MAISIVIGAISWSSVPRQFSMRESNILLTGLFLRSAVGAIITAAIKIAPSINTEIAVLGLALGEKEWIDYLDKVPEVRHKLIQKDQLKKIVINISTSIKKWDPRTIRGLRTRLFKLLRLFGHTLDCIWMYKHKSFDLKTLIEVKNNKGIIKVIDLTGFDDPKRRAILAVLLSKLFELRELAYRGRLKGVPKFVIVIDEIQAFAPDREITPSNAILRKIAQLGRKRGIGLVVATQYPTYMDPQVRRQLVTKIVHAIGVEAARALDLHEVLNKDVLESLPFQEVGTAILVTARDYVFAPLKISVPLSKPFGGKGFET